MPCLTKEQARKLHGLISGHVKAQVELSWKGSQSPEDWPVIEEDAEKAEKALRGYIAALRV